MRSRGKIGLTELVLWDVVLAGVAAGLVYADGRMEADHKASLAAKPAKKTAKKTRAAERDRPRPRDATRRVGADPALERAKQELESIRHKARAHLPADPEQALAVYADASAALQASAAWKAFYPEEERRLLAALRERSLVVCLRPEVQLAADAGRPDLVRALLQRLPSALRSGLESEVGQAERAARDREAAKGKPTKAKKDGGGLEFTGFKPGEAKESGAHCTVVGGGSSLSKALVGDLDGVLTLAVDLLRKPLPGRLEVVVLSAAEDPKPPQRDRRVTRRRTGESDDHLRTRLRLAAARWATRRILGGGGSTLWRGAWSRLLAGVSSTRGTLTASGKARRALFRELSEFDGSGAGLTALARRTGDTASDPAGAGPFALLHMACFGGGAAAPELKRAALDAARGSGGLGEFLTPTRAVGLAKPLAAHMERAGR